MEKVKITFSLNLDYYPMYQCDPSACVVRQLVGGRW